MNLAIFLEQILNGLISGSMYALIGSGIALVYGTMRVLNLAHGEFYMLGGYFTFYLIVQFGLPFWAAIPLAVALAFLLGVLIQKLTIEYLIVRDNWVFTTIAATLGLSIVLQNAALLIFGERFNSVPYYVSGVMVLGDIRLPWQRVLIFVVALVTIAFMTLKYTRIGWSIRATSQDRDAAEVVGIPVRRVYMICFGLAAALGALAAAMLAPINAINPWRASPSCSRASSSSSSAGSAPSPAPSPAGCCSAWSRRSACSSPPRSGAT
jgi:branched-chain amino acid transport system permease protein